MEATTGEAIKPISADSHVSEPPHCYTDYIDPKFRDRAPRLAKNAHQGDVYVIDGLGMDVPLSLTAAAGIDPKKLLDPSRTFEQIHVGAWEPKARLAAQDLDGIAGEVIYPSVGMSLCIHPENDYMQAAFQAYNRWLKDFCDDGEGRLYGIPQVAVNSVDGTIAECTELRKLGFRGVMFPCYPGTDEDYDDPIFDRLWAALSELGMPISFHTFTSRKSRGKDIIVTPRGPMINSFISVTRENQDLIGMFVWSGIFERFPELKIVSVEADAGWLPHYINRMDNTYERHRYWRGGMDFKQLPSQYVLENVYVTFQDDRIAFLLKDELNIRRMMWASDYPHSDSTWPNSQQLLKKHTAGLSEQEKRLVLRGNVIDLYQLDIAA